MLENIYLDNKIDSQTVKKTLSELFPDLTVVWNNFLDSDSEELDFGNPFCLIFTLFEEADRKEFGFNIVLENTPKLNEQERALFLGDFFSKKFNCRVLVPFTHPEEPHSPYYDIIFDQGKTYLADDSDTSFADGSEGLVEILQEYDIPTYKFDSKAQLQN